MRPPGSPKQLEKRRKRAVALLAEGYQPVDVAKMLKVEPGSARRCTFERAWKASKLGQHQGVRRN